MFSQNLDFSNREAEVIVRKLQVCSCGAALAITTLGEQQILVTREVTARDRRQEGRVFRQKLSQFRQFSCTATLPAKWLLQAVRPATSGAAAAGQLPCQQLQGATASSRSYTWVWLVPSAILADSDNALAQQSLQPRM